MATAKVSGFDSGSVPVSVIAFAVSWSTFTDWSVAVGAVFGLAPTVMDTVPAVEVSDPSDAVKVNESGPE